MTDTFEARRKRAGKIVTELKKLFPKAKIVLKYGNNWELLVAVILSAQCTDKKVNEVTVELFKKYRTLDGYLNAKPQDFEQDIKQCGFFHNKAKNILAAGKVIKEKYKGKVPRTMEEIDALPGVARKTANVVLGNAYGIVEGIAVDTHVMRLSQKLGLTVHKDPVKIEQDLMKLLPKKEWFDFTYRLIDYGRGVCPARKHKCEDHSLTKIYPKAANLWP
ncbi:MAG: endonuclease III [Candidatus Wildermuthbacteria bacterium RIFCSPHIGHO2_01_FULL_48_25]|uniref:Endonuclease III n=1 Tax=Candidatus Wildermuthbacteria bacterium RIFCSPLOWO2_01_FULL_48_16 TaxID=1802461 RepID=A0A1G2RJK7_9BACT|nr:MAG: endonuclease III [Candidatus Wildermuthbacteria bacterium RIFCSPHIGHO2_01_FULL_48_25]OHA68891.1 MAG: endonuclease III [Candidatus Wildermuthbacteria bacterium RIFCSPHIGHO2_02_FULL_49_12b]OHA72708.1 MAG: endonuclease III [Candidatus Wildermuthbacteria bacterium RIFCSPLOWO2_01_FULL_48_16]